MNLNKQLNKLYSSDNVLCFFQVQYPVFLVPTKLVERNSEQEFNSLELYIDRLVYEGRVQYFDDIINHLGMKEHRNTIKTTIQGLKDIGHIVEISNRLLPTDLVEESLKENRKITNQLTSRYLYFDHIHSDPLPKYYYESLVPKELEEKFDSYVIEAGGNAFYKDALNKLLKMNGEERDAYAIPQEMVNIDFDLEEDETVKKLYVTLYLALEKERRGHSITAYRNINFVKDEFFTKQVQTNPILYSELMENFFVEITEEWKKYSEEKNPNQVMKNRATFLCWDFPLAPEIKTIKFDKKEINKLEAYADSILFEYELNPEKNKSLKKLCGQIKAILNYNRIVTNGEHYGYVINFKKKEFEEEIFLLYLRLIEVLYDFDSDRIEDEIYRLPDVYKDYFREKYYE